MMPRLPAPQARPGFPAHAELLTRQVHAAGRRFADLEWTLAAGGSFFAAGVCLGLLLAEWLA